MQWVIEARESANPFIKNADVLNSDKISTQEQYKGRSIPGAVKKIKPRYSAAKRSFPWPYEDMKVDDFVKKLGLTYDGGPLAGQPIQEARPFVRSDPFFEHKDMHITLNDDYAMLDDTKPKEKYFVDIFRGGLDDRFALKKIGDNRYPKGVRWLISKVGTENVEVQQSYTDVAALMKLLDAKDKSDLFVCAIVLGLQVKYEDTEPETLKGQIFQKIEIDRRRDTGRGVDGKTVLERAIEVLSRSTEDNKIDYLIQIALKEGRGKFLRKEFGGTYFYKTTDTGAKNLDTLKNWLSRSDNEHILSELLEQFDPKK